MRRRSSRRRRPPPVGTATRGRTTRSSRTPSTRTSPVSDEHVENEVVEEPAVEEPEQTEQPVEDDRLLRLAADFDNYKKRAAREREEYVARANERLVLDLLPILDDLERAL